jgi:predicted permease
MALMDFADRLAHDARYGFRMLISKPGFTAVAVLSVALGIGATTAIFSVVYAVLIDPYPYRAADHIGQVVVSSKKDTWRRINYTKAQYLELKQRVRSMEDVAAVDEGEAVMTGTGLAEVVQREYCSPNFFDFFGVPPLLGRAFTANDFASGTPQPVAVISYKFWQRVFQGRSDVLGQKLRLNDDLYTVIGVLPVRFTWNDVDAYVPMDMRPSTTDFVTVFNRIRPGVSQDQLNAEYQPLLEEFRRQMPPYLYPEGAFKVKFLNVNEGILGKFANTLLALFGAVTLLLLIACANVANLLLARAATREGEMAVRVSIGATRLRLIGQLLTESVLLALTGGLFGIALAFGAIRVVIALMPEYSIPHEAVIALNWPVLWFAFGASVLTGIIFGLAPALRISSETQAETLRGSTRGAGVGVRSRRLHDSLMVAEITLSLVLLTGAGLAISALLELKGQSLGYNPQDALTFLMPLSEGHHTQWADRLGLHQNIVNRLRRSPNVEAAAVSVTGTPPYNGFRSKAILDDRPPSEAPEVRVNLVQDEYLAAVGTKLLRGRDLSEADVLEGRPVAVITEDMARRDFQNKDPLGHHIQIDIFNQRLPPSLVKAPHFTNSFEIIGIAGTARNQGLDQLPIPAMFIPYSMLIPPETFIIARTKGDPEKLVPFVRETVRSVDPNQPITLTRTLEQWLDTATAYPRFATFLFGVFGGIGLLLAVAGVFSVVSYGVAHRTREFGIRMALGAKPQDVLRLVLLTTGRILVAGLFVGLAVSIAASRMLADRMQGMGAANPFLFVLTGGVLLFAALAACAIPARSATRIQPMEALRHE